RRELEALARSGDGAALALLGWAEDVTGEGGAPRGEAAVAKGGGAEALALRAHERAGMGDVPGATSDLEAARRIVGRDSAEAQRRARLDADEMRARDADQSGESEMQRRNVEECLAHRQAAVALAPSAARRHRLALTLADMLRYEDACLEEARATILEGAAA